MGGTSVSTRFCTIRYSMSGMEVIAVWYIACNKVPSSYVIACKRENGGSCAVECGYYLSQLVCITARRVRIRTGEKCAGVSCISSPPVNWPRLRVAFPPEVDWACHDNETEESIRAQRCEHSMCLVVFVPLCCSVRRFLAEKQKQSPQIFRLGHATRIDSPHLLR